MLKRNMLARVHKADVPLAGLAYVQAGATNEDRRTRLSELLGPHIIGAVHRLYAGEDAGTLAAELAKANLSPILTATLALFGDGIYHCSLDVIQALGVSGSTASTLLSDLERLGLLRRVFDDGRLRYFGPVNLPAVEVGQPGFEYCGFCGHQFEIGKLSGVCEVCLEDRL
jgi:DNA-binding transcriptional ArsR family regulator